MSAPGCPQESQVVAAFDGELSPAEMLAFEAHLSTCESCRATRALLAATMPRLEALPLPTVPADLRRRVLSQLPEPQPGLWERLASQWGFGLGLATTAAFAGLVLHAGPGSIRAQGGPGEELALANDLELIEQLQVAQTADLDDDDLEAIALLDELHPASGRN